MPQNDLERLFSQRNARLSQLREALTDATLRTKLARGPDRYENDFAAGSFIAKLLLKIQPLTPAFNRERAAETLRSANCRATVEELEKHHLIRFPLGLLHVPHGVILESLRRERIAADKKRWDLISEDEDLALRTLRIAIQDSQPRFWLDLTEFDKIHEGHLKAHPQTPDFHAMCQDGLLRAISHEGANAAKFHFRRPDIEDPWLTAIERGLALMWEQICKDQSTGSDNERLMRWLNVAYESPTMIESPSCLAPEFRDRLIDAIVSLLLSKSEETTLDKEARKLRFEIDGGLHGDLRVKSAPEVSSGLGETFDWWQNPDFQPIGVTNIGHLDKLVAVVVRYDDKRDAARVVKLLKSSVTHPYLFFAVIGCIEHVNPKAIAALIENPETASLGMHILSRVDIVERQAGWLDGFAERMQMVERKRNVLWELSCEVFLGTWHKARNMEPSAWANMMYEVLLLAARDTAVTESRRDKFSKANDAEMRLASMLDALATFTYAQLEPLLAEFAILLRRSADPARSNWPHARNLPLAELRLAFWWLQLARRHEFRETIDPSAPAYTILCLYCTELERTTTPAGKLIHWVDDAPAIPQLPWQDLALTMQQIHQIQRFLTPEDYSFKRQLDLKDIEGDERSKQCDIWQTLMHKLRLHVRVLIKAYARIRSGSSERVELLSVIERRLIELISTYSKPDPSSGRPSIFEFDSTPSLRARPRTSDTLAHQAVQIFNEFRNSNRRAAFDSWIEIEKDPVVLLKIFTEALPVDARQKAMEKLGTIDIDSFIKAQVWLPEIQRFAEQASLASRTDIVEKILVFGDERLKGHSLRSDWDLFAYQIRLRSAYQKSGTEAIERVPSPPNLEKHRQNINGKIHDSVVESRKFFLGLALIKSNPLQAKMLFEDLRGQRQGVWADLVNWFAASLSIAQREPDRELRKRAFDEVFEEWNSENVTMPSEERRNPAVQLNELICYDGAERDREFDMLWDGLRPDAKGRLDFVRAAVHCFSRRNLPDRIEKVLDHARPFYVDEQGRKAAEFEEVEKEAAEGHVSTSAPGTTDNQKDYTPDELRRAFLEICDRLPEDVAEIIDGRDTPIHEFIWQQLHATAKEFLNQETIWRTFKIEDNHNDFFVSLLRMRVAILKWQIHDQTRGGVSESGKQAGERDWILRDSGKRGEIAIFEGLRLSGVDTGPIRTHLNKLIKAYNSVGLPSLFFVVYYEGSSAFDDFWNAYLQHVTTTDFAGLYPIKWEEDVPVTTLTLRSILVVYQKDGIPIFLRHLVMLLPKHN